MKQKLFKLIPAFLLATISPLTVKAADTTLLGGLLGGSGGSGGAGGWGKGLGDAGKHSLPTGSISAIVFNLAAWLLLLLGSIALIGFVISGILYLTAAGNEERMETAKKGMIYSVIGVIVGLLGYVVVQAVNTWLGGSDADF